MMDQNLSNFNQPKGPKGLAICIPTFKRPQLLYNLLNDLEGQNIRPNFITIVDGDPGSLAVMRMLFSLSLGEMPIIGYVPSNHANLSYQRYLGYRVARDFNAKYLLYLDDDLRIHQRDAVEKTIKPLFWPDQNIVGVTAHLTFGGISKFSGAAVLIDRARGGGKSSRLVRWFGTSRKVPPGGITPAGQRRPPVFQGNDYEPVEWLRGGIMAYRMEALTENCFSDDLFALDHIRCGLGEDTFLSRRVRTKGKLLLAFCASFEHPDEDLPKSYPIKAFNFGYASAYSRRLLNEHFRGFDPPLLSHRLALVKSYLGAFIINWGRVIAGPKSHRVAFAWGYTLGMLRGLWQKPTAKRLTPNIDWWRDAEVALQNLVILNEATYE
jgi:GT2 family glycosyltransferase